MVVVDRGDPAAPGRRRDRAVGQEPEHGVRVRGQRRGAGDGAPVGEQRPDRGVPIGVRCGGVHTPFAARWAGGKTFSDPAVFASSDWQKVVTRLSENRV